MRSIMALVLVVAASPLAGQSRVDETRPFTRDGNFKIMVLEGSLTIRGWDGDSVRVRGTFDGAARRGFYFGASPEGAGKLGVEGDGRADVEVFLPAGTRVWVKTAGAPIEVTGITAPVDLYSVTGGIRFDGSPRAVYAESMGGDIELVGAPQVARLRTGSGSIRVRGAGSDLSLMSVSGGIALEASAAIRRAVLETVGGRVRVEAPLSPGGALMVTTHDGAVELALPRSTGADFLVTTVEGRLTNELTASGASKTTGLQGRELTLTAGQGGAEVTVRTFSGHVTIRPRDDG